jgi:hypothetical protein
LEGLFQRNPDTVLQIAAASAGGSGGSHFPEDGMEEIGKASTEQAFEVAHLHSNAPRCAACPL